MRDATHWALEATTDNVILVDREFRITYINRSTAELNGISPESVLGKSLWEQWPGNLGTDIERNYRKAMAEGVPVRFVHGYVEADRFDLWLEISAFPSPDGLAIFFHDVSDARREAARKAEDAERLARAINATDLGVWRVDLPFDGAPFYLSPQVRRHFGVSEDEPIAMEQFVALLHPDDVQMATDAIARAIAERVPYDIVYRTVGRDGKTRWVKAMGNAFYREDGTPYRFDGYTLDYTELRETQARERAALETLRANEERLEAAVSERTLQLQAAVREAEGFNHSVAHDLRAPLRGISATSGILLEELGEGLSREHRSLLLRQSQNATRLGRLIDELLRLSRFARAEVSREKLDMTAQARSVFRELESQGRASGCRLDVQEGMVAEGDAGLVRTILHNLIGNACKFSPDGGTVRVSEADGIFSVRDEGVGFDMEHAKRMFLPFERLVADREFEGTGIGLANVERIVRRHGGHVWAESEPGKGAAFHFTLGP